ncbi:hypothetical protein [Lentimicrobium sp.]|uniref:hypothetical protein n=1 Tax=Lentimicrobium sp. TaxID=2034841 RepID=UPI00345E0991
MKNKYILKALLGIIAVIVSIIAFNAFTALVAGGAVLAMAGTIVGESVNTENITDQSSNLLRPEISQKVTMMQPSRTVLDTITNMITPVKTKAFTYKFYAVENRPFTDTLAVAYTKSGDGSETASLTVTDISMWTITDTLIIQGSTGDDGYEVGLYIYDKDVDASKIKVQAYNNEGSGTMDGLQVIPSIAKDTVLTRMATAKFQDDAQTQVYQRVPTDTSQYLQIFMAQIEEGEYAADNNKEVDWSFLDYSKQVIYDFKATKELSYLFGCKAQITDKLTGYVKYLTGGVVRSIDNELEYDTVITNDNLIDWHKSNFAGNAGSNSKVVFGGSTFTALLLKLKTTTVDDQTTPVTVTLDYVVKRQNPDSIKVDYGIELRKITTNFGTWYYYYHPLLDEAGWAAKAIVLDLAHIEKVVWKPMEKRTIDLKASGQKKAKALVIEETSALVLRYPDVHAVIDAAA